MDSTINSTNDGQKESIEEDKLEDYNEEEDEEEPDDLSEEAILAVMGYSKSEPKRKNTKEHKEQYYDEEEEEEDDNHFSHSSLFSRCKKNEPPKDELLMTPTNSLNLVSALKGSRQKEGKSCHELRVSWAPDVYDPPTSSPDLFATDRPKIKLKVKNSAAGKNKQKAGGKGAGKSGVKDKNKDKKQGKKKRAGKSSNYED